MVMWNPWTGQGDCRELPTCQEDDYLRFPDEQDRLIDDLEKKLEDGLKKPTNYKCNGLHMCNGRRLGCIRNKPRVRRYFRRGDIK